MPQTMLKYPLQRTSFTRYTDIDYQYRYHAEGDLFMHGSVKITAMMIMLCLSLMLGACSAPTNTIGSSQTKANHTVTSSNSDGQAAVQTQTRTVKTLRRCGSTCKPETSSIGSVYGSTFKTGDYSGRGQKLYAE